MGRVADLLAQRFDDPRLADPGLAGQEDGPTFVTHRPGPAVHYQVDLTVAAEQPGRTPGLPRLEATFGGMLAKHPPAWNRTGHSLQELPTEILEIETPAQQLPRALGDHDRVHFGDALQSSGQVRRLADHDLLAFPHRLAHHDEPRGDTDPDFQSHGALQRQPGDLFDHREPGSDGTFGVVLMGKRIAKIGQHPVAHELRGRSVEPRDRPDASILKRTDDLPEVLRVKTLGKRRRPGHVTEHDGQVAAFRVPQGRPEVRRPFPRKDIRLTLAHESRTALAAESGAGLGRCATGSACRRRRTTGHPGHVVPPQYLEGSIWRCRHGRAEKKVPTLSSGLATTGVSTTRPAASMCPYPHSSTQLRPTKSVFASFKSAVARPELNEP